MVLTYSPSSESGGLLQFPSPTHPHHFDPTSALLQLRRSLSRSPSRGPAFRLITTTASKPGSPNSPLSPSPLSPQKRARYLRTPDITTNAFPVPTTQNADSENSPTFGKSNSPIDTEYPVSARGTRASLRKLSPMRSANRPMSRSPARRVLAESKDNGNASSPLSQESSSGSENQSVGSKTPEQVFMARGSPESSDVARATHHYNLRPDRHGGYFSDIPFKSSPLKRNEKEMNLHHGDLASPSAKRRSLHGGIIGGDFNIFDQAAMEIPKSGSISPDAMMPSFSDNVMPSPMSKRTTSLRKSTLQQRHDRPAMSRSKAMTNLAQEFSSSAEVAHQEAVQAKRHSMDGSLMLQNAVLLMSAVQHEPKCDSTAIETDAMSTDAVSKDIRAPTSRHPLSRTVTQSSSDTSLAADSPTHAPLRQVEQRRLRADLSKSLPIGSARPQHAYSRLTTESSQDGAFATPENYKNTKPLQAVFMSTGLISKRTKVIQDEELGSATKQMPDTPCKKQMAPNPLAPAGTPAPGIPRQTNFRRSLHSFGTPSTPFNSGTSQKAAGGLGRGASIFGSGFHGNGMNRRGSFLSVDGDDFNQSPSGKLGGQSSNEFVIPPTPTKQVVQHNGSHTPFHLPRESFMSNTANPDALMRSVEEVLGPPAPAPKCKFVLSSPASQEEDEEGGDNCMDESPSVGHRFRSMSAISQLSRKSILGDDHFPGSPSRKSHTLPHIRTSNLNAKPSPLSPASPLFGRYERPSPKTPKDGRESVAPPDPSGLSISAKAPAPGLFRTSTFGNTLGASTSTFPPATPTANRDSLRFSLHRSTASNTIAEAQVDQSLTSRFDEVEMIGTGEFSSVFKVTKRDETTMSQGSFGSFNDTPSAARTPRPGKIWAVKKLRSPYLGPKDRQRKLQEVEVLRTLGQSEHTLQLLDHWESAEHLYIQTEYCEEGSLDMFLIASAKSRLDDFRIWKILLEVANGIKHIHDSGFIHLDLKPANILITFEGVLKIADFGMATSWPAPPGIEGEGDREYIAPEILMGKFDKPADVFALGIIMLEIAANVILPDNGKSWRDLREGETSNIVLTSSSEASIIRNESGEPLNSPKSSEDLNQNVESPQPRQITGHRFRAGELPNPPGFMEDKENRDSLDNLVQWMMQPEPAERPNVDLVLGSIGCRWVDERRRAGATIYEGAWGPADEILENDAEMIDV